MPLTSRLSNGRAVIPATLRAKLGIQDGDQLIWEERQGELVVTTRRAQLQRARAIFQKYVPPGSPSLADELIAERRAEADRQ